jgi:DNA modification methylase
MVGVFREVRRVLRADGTCWVNLGDSFDEKQLVGMPHRVAFALQADGWWLRSDIVWSKPNPMPESVSDRPTKAHEYVFLLTKSPRYFFDQEAVREPNTEASLRDYLSRGHINKSSGNGETSCGHGGAARVGTTINGRNIRSVWEIATQPYPEAHFATFPEALPERCILAGTSERGCCPVCAAPWEREVERSGGTIGKSWHEHDTDLSVGQRSGSRDHKRASADGYERDYRRETLGWRPTCRCLHCPVAEQVNGACTGCRYCETRREAAEHPVPCTVLDPFMGSGTTALVARRLGRRSIGIELNPEYAELCARRLQQLSLFAGAS